MKSANLPLTTSPGSRFEIKLEKTAALRRFDDFAGFETPRADFDAMRRAVDKRTHRLQIRIEAPPRPVVCVGNVIAELGAFPTDFTTFGHNSPPLVR
jgi:hypothetical protein